MDFIADFDLIWACNFKNSNRANRDVASSSRAIYIQKHERKTLIYYL